MCPVEVRQNGSITSPAGFTAGAIHSGLRPTPEPDLAVVLSSTPCSGAGVFTTNKVRAAPVLYDEELLLERPGRIRAIVMNAHYANACTGTAGLADATVMAETTESVLELPARTCLVLSTGVIGTTLPMSKVTTGIRSVVEKLHADGGIEAATAIMTTDTRPKHIAVTLETPAGPVTIGGIAKGSGMIHPNMATMLGIITTDARVEAARLTSLLLEACDRTFNAITVDGDTSTNDSVLLLANGASGIDIARDAEVWTEFTRAVELVARELALAIVRDGEGATRLIELTITGANTETTARAIGRAIARSSLVKTAWFGGDANWGRILAAAGASGQPLDSGRLTLHARRRPAKGEADGPWIELAKDGATAEADEATMASIFSAPEIAIRLDVGVGGASATVWTCDLSNDYIEINAHYRT